MTILTRTLLLNTFIKNETLTVDNISDEDNLGMLLNTDHLKFLLIELTESGYLNALNDVIPWTYTITDKGIREGARLNEEISSPITQM